MIFKSESFVMIHSTLRIGDFGLAHRLMGVD